MLGAWHDPGSQRYAGIGFPLGFSYLNRRLLDVTGVYKPITLKPVTIRLMDKILHDPKDPNYGNYGIFLIMGNAGFCPSAVCYIHPPLTYATRALELGCEDLG